ncbi:amino acid adenylation domain-containing protein [Kribbella sp. NBC_01505]|uniref:amino acid adenylation domain-containing protein n=1 Tax=Kribbella sp. NBC_01505 TaxID=2903580 RepID=UPI003864A0E9
MTDGRDLAADLPTDLRRRLAAWSQGAPDQSAEPKTVHQRVLARAAADPHATAVVGPDANLTYEELDERSMLVARGLAAAGVQHGDLVALCLPRSIDLVLAMLGVWRAGAGYVPIDVGTPAARAQLMLAETGAALVVTDRSTPAGPHTVRRISVPDLTEAGRRFEQLPVPAGHRDLAYVIYTSGSTGRPKGVLVEHRSVTAMLDATVPLLGLRNDDVWSFLHAAAFDFSVWEIWGCLSTGGRLVIACPETGRDPAELHQLLIRHGVTVLCQTPSAFTLLDEVDADSPEHLSGIRLVILAGETLQVPHLSRWRIRYRDHPQRLVNMYGITETTVFCTAHQITGTAGTRYPIGAPIPGWELYVVGADGRLARPGEVGEIWVAGPGVSRGYLHRPDLTARQFVNALVLGKPRRLYRSGDLAAWSEAGQLLYHGRTDDQVKLRGHRIELGEVEAAIGQLRGVRQGAVVFRADAALPERERIEAYVAGAGDLDSGAVRDELSRVLPGYMVPATVTVLSELPSTTSGKVDRGALAASTPTAGGPEAPTGESTGRVSDLVRRLWTDLLPAGSGPDEDFFRSGGNSLLAARLAEELRRQGFPRLRIDDIFRHPTQAALASWLGEHGDDPQQAPAGQLDFVLGCLPHAGAGASFFWSWKSELPPTVTLCSIQRPGREDRLHEPAHHDLAQAAEDAAEQLLAMADPRKPFVVFGHSSGGMLAYQLTRALLGRGTQPQCLVLSGIASLDIARDHGRRHLDDDALVASVARTVGYDHPALHHPELRNLVLPALRADVTAHELYEPAPPVIIDVPILALRGDADPVVTAADAAGWADVTTRFTTLTVAGGHMAPVEQPRRLLNLIADHLGELRATA